MCFPPKLKSPNMVNDLCNNCMLTWSFVHIYLYFRKCLTKHCDYLRTLYSYLPFCTYLLLYISSVLSYILYICNLPLPFQLRRRRLTARSRSLITVWMAPRVKNTWILTASSAREYKAYPLALFLYVCVHVHCFRITCQSLNMQKHVKHSIAFI